MTWKYEIAGLRSIWNDLAHFPIVFACAGGVLKWNGLQRDSAVSPDVLCDQDAELLIFLLLSKLLAGRTLKMVWSLPVGVRSSNAFTLRLKRGCCCCLFCPGRVT